MKVILLERVAKLGQMGDVCDVKTRVRTQLFVATEKSIVRIREQYC